MAESLIVLETISSRVNQVHVFISFFQNSYENCEPNFWRVWISFSELKRGKGWRELIWGCPIHSFPFFFCYRRFINSWPSIFNFGEFNSGEFDCFGKWAFLFHLLRILMRISSNPWRVWILFLELKRGKGWRGLI